MSITLVLGIAAGFLCTVSFIPQIIKIYSTKNVEDLSLITFSVFSLGVFLWLIYGILIKEPPIIIANIATLIFIVTILIMKIRYDKKGR